MEIKTEKPAQSAPTLAHGAPFSAFAAPLSVWYRENARALPWREDPPSAYHVWLSEIMLQQTRIEAVRPYYTRFLAAAPDVETLAALPDDRLMKLWEGLGYYSRARNLKKAAVRLVEQYGGQFPPDYQALLSLPGVGEYTAGAIASLVFGLPVPAVDGNVLRVIARLTSDPSDVTSPATKKKITAALREVYENLENPNFKTHGPAEKGKHGAEAEMDLPPTPATLTSGLMELGEVICIPTGAPKCDLCPLAHLCRAREEGSTDRIPYRAPRAARRRSYRLVLLLHDGKGNYALRRRPSEGLLAGLWELPNIELPTSVDGARAAALAADFCRAHGLIPAEMAEIEPARHLFTHIEWQMQGLYINVLPADRSSAETEKQTPPSANFAAAAQTDLPLVFAAREALDTDFALPSAFRAFRRYITGEH